MLRKKLAMLLAVVMVAGTVVGCGSGDDSAKKDEPATAPAADDSTSEPATDDTETPATDDESAGGDEATDDESAGGSSGELIKVGIINNDPNESGYRTANDADLKETFTKEKGYDASFAYSMKNDEQITAAQKFIQDGVDYLLISAADTAGWESVLTDAQTEGIGVILFDRTIDAPEDLYAASIVSDMEKEGQTAVDWLTDQKLDKYQIIHLQGAMGTAAQQGRTKALEEAVAANDNWEYVGEPQTAEWNAEKAQQIVQAAIDSGKEFNVIYAENDDMAKGAVAALDKANISHGVDKDVIIMGFDCNKWALEELKAGNWNYDGQCNPFQSKYISDVIKELEAGNTLSEKTIVMEEKGFDAKTITDQDIEDFGI